MKSTDLLRRGVSLIEILVAIAILAILIGLVLVGVQKIREAAIHAQNKNNLRQIILGVHQIASEKDGTITDLTKSSMKGITFANGDSSLFRRLLPYVHGPREFSTNMSNEQMADFIHPIVKVYRNPADPSWDYEAYSITSRGKCSYALNMLALDGSISLVTSIPDGSSHTIAIGDKYYSKCSPNSKIPTTSNVYSHLFEPYQGEIYNDRRATFADRGWQDVLPVHDPISRSTRPSVPGKTFQVRPRPEDADPSILQTAFQAGLTVAMFDGSVRTLSPSIHESIFWGLVTPNGGEVLGDY